MRGSWPWVGIISWKGEGRADSSVGRQCVGTMSDSAAAARLRVPLEAALLAETAAFAFEAEVVVAGLLGG